MGRVEVIEGGGFRIYCRATDTVRRKKVGTHHTKARHLNITNLRMLLINGMDGYSIGKKECPMSVRFHLGSNCWMMEWLFLPGGWTRSSIRTAPSMENSNKC